MSGKKSTDRRIRHTEAALTKALTALLKEKSPRDITVTELCRLADVNRGTFYLHYKDIGDMLAHLENDVLEQCQEMLDAHNKTELYQTPYSLIYDLFLFASSHTDLFRLLISSRTNNLFVRRLNSLFYKQYLNVFRTAGEDVSPQKLQYSFHFLASGCISMMELWLFSEQPEPVPEIAELATDFITTCYHSLLSPERGV